RTLLRCHSSHPPSVAEERVWLRRRAPSGGVEVHDERVRAAVRRVRAPLGTPRRYRFPGDPIAAAPAGQYRGIRPAVWVFARILQEIHEAADGRRQEL